MQVDFEFLGVQMIQSRVICHDTYMEIKCTSFGPDESIVVMDAQLVMEVDSNICPNIVGKTMLHNLDWGNDSAREVHNRHFVFCLRMCIFSFKWFVYAEW